MQDDFQLYFQFKNPHVRAIAWILNSPSVLSETATEKYPSDVVARDWGERIYHENLDWLKSLDQNPQDLIAYLEKFRSYRLGIRFEKLIIFIFEYLQHQGVISHFASNLSIDDAHKKTLGELDIVFYDPLEKKRQHWELAVKYYLFRPEEFNYQRWNGPNGSDWLHRKVDHLLTRQLGISNTSEAQIALQKHFGDEISQQPILTKAFVKGELYYPLEQKVKLNQDESKLINPDGLSGWWTYPEFFYQANPDQVGRWLVLEKLQWIVPQFYAYDYDDLLTPKEMSLYIKHHFMRSKRSLYLAHFLLDVETQCWIEHDRGFIVDRLWPLYVKD